MPAQSRSRLLALLFFATLLLALAALSSFAQPASAEEADEQRPSVMGGFGVTDVTRPPSPPEEEDAADEGQRDKRLRLTVPGLGMKDLLVRNSPDQSFLDREGIMHLAGTDFPWEEGSNTYIAGHAIGYPGGRVPEAFRNLVDLGKGDRITIRDARGETYRYRVYERLLVDPYDFWVTEPVPGKDIVSLQTCYPEPTFEKRLVVRAELVD